MHGALSKIKSYKDIDDTFFSIHCFFAKPNSKRMVRNDGEERGGVAMLEDVRCHASQRKSLLNSARNMVLITSHVSMSKMLLLRKVIPQRCTL
jgi:hypothetical protein